MSRILLPGETLGLMGGGQLGRMFAQAAATMGYHVAVLEPGKSAPAAEVSLEAIVAPYDDEAALEKLARRVKAADPDMEVVFIGPCLAKRYEGDHVPEVDNVMSFEELGAFLIAYGIDVVEDQKEELNPEVTAFGRGYALAGGVRSAIAHAVGDEYTTINIEGLDKKNAALLKAMPKKPAAQFIEVMACEGGCVTGPCVYGDKSAGQKQLMKELAKFK